ncbi:olfactory receptor 5AR1-like [Lissotriton helveticus]
METANESKVTDFIFLGFKDLGNISTFLFVLFVMIYCVTLACNLGIIVLVCVDYHLHTPMYFFLCNLSFMDFWYSSAITPKFLVDLLTEHKSISFAGCALQLFFASTLGGGELFLLSVMAYDRYAAICHPLHYSILMAKKVCLQLVNSCYVCATLHSLIHTTFMFRLSFCSNNEINHYYCDIPPLLALSCTDTFTNEMLLFSFGGLSILGSFLVIIVSYTYIVVSILKVHSEEGRHRVFSTCSSHLTVVVLFYGTIIFNYLRPSSKYSLDRDKVASVFYTMVIPMLNPLIYSLRNKEVKGALMRAVARKHYCI